MTLKEFQDVVYAGEGQHGNRNMDYCNWFFKDTQIFHERTYWNSGIPKFNATPAQLFHFANAKTDTQYWSETIWTDLDLAKKESKKYNARVQEGWYCEAPDLYWFLIFNDLDMAIEQAYHELKKSLTI